jgi:hypothetical protein
VEGSGELCADDGLLLCVWLGRAPGDRALLLLVLGAAA